MLKLRLILLLAALTLPAAAQQSRCLALAHSAPGVTIQSAKIVPAAATKAGRLPAFCEVQGAMHLRRGADGALYGIHFDLRMPQPWNGKFLYQGGGGLDGFVAPAIGPVSASSPPALARGYAVVSTDSGHTGPTNSAFGREQQARLDYAYHAIGEVTRAAKELIAAYYRKPIQHSYFMGCSNGGREAMMAVQRYPLEFDGAIAGDPGFRLSHAAIAEPWDTETLEAIAPRDAQGRPILSQALSPADLHLVSQAVLKQCDALDGLRDGEINNYAACHFTPAVLACKPGQSAGCLTAPKLHALERIFAGAHTSSGTPLYSGWPWDAGIDTPGWRIWKLGFSPTAQSNALNVTLGSHALKDYFVHPYRPNFNPNHVNFDKIAAEVAETGAINDATSTDLSTFAARGGKLLLYQGLSDPIFSATDLIAYYNRFARDNGGLKKARSVARLFLVPGMNHCGGGPATDTFDTLTALNRWVVDGHAPERILATGRAFPGRTRPLCAYPQYAQYKGTGNPQNAESFVCR